MSKCKIAIPMGDPAGVGPEIVVKALNNELIQEETACVIIGDKAVLQETIGLLGLPLTINVITNPEEGDYQEGILNVIDIPNVVLEELRMGEVSGMCGKAAYAYIEKAISLAMSGAVDAVTTTPINKESFRAGKVPYIGHTEVFGALTQTTNPLTMFEVRGMRVFFLSRHMSLRQACESLSKEKIKECVKRCFEMLEQIGVVDGTLAIAGLNPHCGEHGLFGTEEVDYISPAVEELVAEGYPVVGPIGADSVFHMALKGKYNSVLSLYHDQGHIATKTLDFERTISVTGGMPILRTSVDHGTGFDIAGKGIASPISMIEAIEVARKYARYYGRKV